MRAISSISHHSDHIVYGVIAVVCSKHSRRFARIGALANTGDRRRFLQLAGVVASLGAAVLAAGVAGASAASPTGGSAPTGRASPPPLAPVPYMGWNTYYGVGGIFDEPAILSVARSLLDRGLARAGYRIVWLDFGWASGKRDVRGQLIVDPQQWPHGLRWLTDWLHRRHLLAGIY